MQEGRNFQTKHKPRPKLKLNVTHAQCSFASSAGSLAGLAQLLGGEAICVSERLLRRGLPAAFRQLCAHAGELVHIGGVGRAEALPNPNNLNNPNINKSKQTPGSTSPENRTGRRSILKKRNHSGELVHIAGVGRAEALPNPNNPNNPHQRALRVSRMDAHGRSALRRSGHIQFHWQVA